MKWTFLKRYDFPQDTYLITYQVNSLSLLQKKIIRIMAFSPYLAHTAPIFIDLAILPFNKIFIDRISITMFKVEYELLPKSVTQMFTKKIKIFIHITPEIEIYLGCQLVRRIFHITVLEYGIL